MTTKPVTYYKIGFVTIFVIFFGIYGFFRSLNFLQGPSVRIMEPADGASFSHSFIKVRGGARNIAVLYLNGRQIFTNEKGDFEEKILLGPGQTTIEVEARDKFNRKVKVWREVVLQ